MNEDIIGLIPAAGKGLRLGLPYPKELFPVIRDNSYKPISQFVVDNLTASGVQHIVFVINDTKHQLIGFFGDGHRFGCHISYVVQESYSNKIKSTSPGLAHALVSGYHLIRNKTVFFGMADTIMQPLDIFAQAYKTANQNDDYEAILTLFPTDRPEKGGMVKLENDNKVLKVVDKPRKTKLTMSWGCIIWRPQFTEYLNNCVRNQNIADFADIMNRSIKDGLRFRGFHIPDSSYIDIGTYEEIKKIDHRYR